MPDPELVFRHQSPDEFRNTHEVLDLVIEADRELRPATLDQARGTLERVIFRAFYIHLYDRYGFVRQSFVKANDRNGGLLRSCDAAIRSDARIHAVDQEGHGSLAVGNAFGDNLDLATFSFGECRKPRQHGRVRFEGHDLSIGPLRRRQSAGPLRDIRYLAERLRTATLMPPPESSTTVAFGSTVTFARDDGRVQTYRIVGEDEADPKAGTISYVSPVARLLIGKSVGDVVMMGAQELEIVAVG